MHRYRVFGLTVGSDVRLDELVLEPNTEKAVDLAIVLKDVGYEIKPMGEGPVRFVYDDPRGLTMIWPGAAAVRVVSTDLVEIQPFPGVPDTYLPFPLLGPVMAWVLHLRKFLVLHASAVTWKGHSVGFMGDKMAGKSTTAASFLRAGAELLTDDLLAIDMTDPTQPTICPAFPQLKLSDDSAENIDVPGAKPLPLVMEGFDKKQYRLTDMHHASARCDTLFVIERGGQKPSIDWLESAEAMTSIMRYSYNVRFGSAPLEMQDRARYFQQYAGLARNARVGRLNIPKSVERLCETVEFIEQHVISQEL